jgi:hypothetical protein
VLHIKNYIDSFKLIIESYNNKIFVNDIHMQHNQVHAVSMFSNLIE